MISNRKKFTISARICAFCGRELGDSDPGHVDFQKLQCTDCFQKSKALGSARNAKRQEAYKQIRVTSKHKRSLDVQQGDRAVNKTCVQPLEEQKLCSYCKTPLSETETGFPGFGLIHCEACHIKEFEQAKERVSLALYSYGQRRKQEYLNRGKADTQCRGAVDKKEPERIITNVRCKGPYHETLECIYPRETPGQYRYFYQEIAPQNGTQCDFTISTAMTEEELIVHAKESSHGFGFIMYDVICIYRELKALDDSYPRAGA